jgi:hypothetical protein
MKITVEEGEVNRKNKSLDKGIRRIFIVALLQENAINSITFDVYSLINFVENFQITRVKQ